MFYPLPAWWTSQLPKDDTEANRGFDIFGGTSNNGLRVPLGASLVPPLQGSSSEEVPQAGKMEILGSCGGMIDGDREVLNGSSLCHSLSDIISRISFSIVCAAIC